MDNKERFQEVQRIAKELKTKDPKLKHVEAVSKAWKIIKTNKEGN